MGQQVGGKNAFIYFLKFELKNFFIEVQKKAFKHDLNNYVAGEDIMEVGMGKQTKVLTSFPKVTRAIFNKLSLFSTAILHG